MGSYAAYPSASSAFQPVNAVTSSFTVSSSQAGFVFTNRGAAGTTTATLPPATGSGAIFTFICYAAQFFQIQVNAGDTINLGGITSTNQFRTFSPVGSFFTIVDLAPNLWVAIAVGGNWSVN